MDHSTPDIRRVRVFDDLPESIITREIFPRLPGKDVLRCTAVSKWWRAATTTKEFLLDHHSRQPSLPLVVFRRETSRAVDVLDIRRAPAERRPVLRFNDCSHDQTFRVCASCDGLLLLSLMYHVHFCIVNPATRQWLALPRLAGAFGNIAGMYRRHPHRSDEYRILFWRGKHEVRNAGYYVLTVCSSQKPKYLGGLPVASACTTKDVLAGIKLHSWRPPILFNGCLHWDPHCSLTDKILVFDTMEESFRCMSTPNTARGDLLLLQMEGMLGFSCLDKNEGVMKIWVLHDYEREVWSLKCQIAMSVVKYWRTTLISNKSDMLIYYEKPYLLQLHYDDNGKLLEQFQWETDYPDITEHWFKESLIRHTFFPRRCSSGVKQARFFRML